MTVTGLDTCRVSAVCSRPAAGRRSVLPILGILAAFIAGPADAYWEIVPDVRTGITHESNPRNRVTDERDATSAFIDVRLPATWKTAVSELEFMPRVRFAEFAGSRNEDLDSDDYYANLNYARKSLRHQWGATSSYQDTDVRNSEFFSATPEDPDAEPPPDGGFGTTIFPDDRRRTWSVAPFWQAALTERNTMNIAVSTSDTRYDQELRNTYFDYTYRSGQLSIAHSLNLQSSITLSVNTTEFDAKHPENSSSQNTTNTRSFYIGYQRAITPTLSATMNVGTSRSTVRLTGAEWTDSNGFPCGGLACRSADENFVGDVSLRKRSELTTMNLGVSRSTAPRSDGTEVVRDSVNFFMDRRLTARLIASVGAIYSDESAVGDLIRQDRKYFSTDLSARWQFSRTWWLYGTYTFRKDDYDITGVFVDSTSRDNNRVIVGVQYRGIGIRR